MEEQELARLVVRLLGESSSFEKMFQDAKQEVEDGKKKLEDTNSVLGKLTSNLGKFAATAATAFGSFKLLDFLKESESMYKEAATAERQLTSILKIQGRDVDTLKKQYGDLAEEMMKKLGVDDDSIIALAKQTELMGLTGEAAERAIKNAHALAAAHGGVADSYIRQTIALENGKIGRLGLLLGMGEMEEGTDKVAEAQNKLNKMWQFAEEEGQTYGARLKRQEAELGNLREEYGKIVKESLQPFREAMFSVEQQSIEWFASMNDGTKKLIVQVTALVGALGSLVTVLGVLSTFKETLLSTASAMKKLTMGFITHPITIWTAAIVGTALALKELSDIITGAEDRRRQLAQRIAAGSTVAQGEIAGFKSQQDARMQDSTGVTDEATAQTRITELQEELNKMNELINLRQQGIDQMQKAVQDRNVKIRHIPILGDAFDEDFKDAQGRLKNLQDVMNELTNIRGAIKKRIEDLGKIKDPTGGPLFGVILNATVMSTASGKAAELAKSFQEQANMFGLSAREAAIYKLQLDGVSDEMLSAAREQDHLLTLMEEDARLKQEGKSVTQQFMTPLEQYNTRMDELNNMLRVGAISQETFNRAAEDAQKTLDASAESAKEANTELQRLDATLAGGAEAKARVAAFKTLLTGQNAELRASRNAVGPSIQNTSTTTEDNAAVKSEGWLEKIFRLLEKQDQEGGADIEFAELDI